MALASEGFVKGREIVKVTRSSARLEKFGRGVHRVTPKVGEELFLVAVGWIGGPGRPGRLFVRVNDDCLMEADTEALGSNLVAIPIVQPINERDSIEIMAGAEGFVRLLFTSKQEIGR